MTSPRNPRGLPAPAPAWLSQLRKRRQAVTYAEFTRARRFVDLAGIVPLLTDARQQQRKSNAGRTRTVGFQALFTAMTLASWRSQGRVVLAEATDILAHQLPATARTELGLPAWEDTAKGFEAAYLAVRRTFHAAEAVIDPSPLPKHRLTREEAARLHDEADPAELTARRHRLVEVTNRIIEASLAPARSALEEHWDGSVAVDATAVRTFSRGVNTSCTHTATDPDAAWYVREGDHRDPADRPPAPGKKKRKAKRYLFGFEATLVVTGDTPTTPPPGKTPPGPQDQPARLPALVLAFTLHKPGHDPAGNAVAALRDVHRRHYPTGWLAADRAYSTALPEKFHIPVRDLGYRPVFDYRTDQLGIQTSHAGALLIDGTWYCPDIPPILITTTADLLTGTIDKPTWQARVHARTAYRLRPKAAPDHRGARRMLCPAAGTHPTVACPLKTRSLGRDPRLPVIDITPTPAGAPEICRRESLTFTRDTGIRFWQELDHGLAPWAHHYFHLRNRVEHFNHYAKDHEAIERSRTRRIRGVAAQSLLLSFQIAHANHRKLATWHETLPLSDQPARRRPSTRHKPRNPHNWTPRGYQPGTPSN
ncbi:hypothetical protein AF335_05010 [Streptomyces eurocidicus]|uniref:Transposase n=1 Tax=Streptomyces eurocidicus TaxID=66423 RepID=A0A2N8NZ56_STREU|nr:hypothetical protein [Streptomyces eurocidicus]MBB5122743.1 hypothetical protein [Streptomyces eurocidicus]MBF6055210.1 hypothetical protein [Streptomyces eurocidicus]PNE34042.1 hypothetical protein AF335_05010 [Streptomyces eurocidicus]